MPQRLGDAVHHVEPGHLFVPDLGVQPNDLAIVQCGDKGQGVADGRQQDVAPGLVRLGLDGEPDAVVAVAHVRGEGVHRLAVAVERGPDVLGAVVL